MNLLTDGYGPVSTFHRLLIADVVPRGFTVLVQESTDPCPTIESIDGTPPDHISSPGQRPRRRVALWGGLAALAVAVAVGGFVALGREDTSSVAIDTASDSSSVRSFDPSWRPGRCDTPTPRAERTPAEQLASRDASRAAMEEAHRTAWTRFRDRLADGSGWLCG